MTAVSLLVCVIVVGAAVFAISSGALLSVRLTLSAILMGTGIFSMHYIGMTALHASAHMEHAPAYVAASLAIAIAASELALWLATGRGGRPPLILSALVFGIAVSGMHYTAMAGMTLFPHTTAVSGAPALSTDLLAIVVAVVGFCVSALFLLFLVPDRALDDSTSMQGVREIPVLAGNPEFADSESHNVEFGRGTTRRLEVRARRLRASRVICRSSMTAPLTSSPSMTWSQSTPMLITPTFSMARPSCSARWRSAKSNRGSTKADSSASTAATSSISSG